MIEGAVTERCLFSPKFSVLTPAWNRAECLEELRNSLMMQSDCSFEWIVGNDGSTDGTAAVVESLARHANFHVLLINAEKHIGKSRIDNLLVAAASGDFCVWCDAGDKLHETALSSLRLAWSAIPDSEKANYLGIAPLAESDGKVLGKAFEANAVLENLTLRDVEGLVGADMLLAARTEILRSVPFPEVDLVIPESSVWSKLGDRLVRFVPRPLKVVVYGQANAISGSGRMAYSRGRAHALALQKASSTYSPTARESIRNSFNFIRYCLHGEIRWRDAIDLWGGKNKSRLMLALMYVPGLLASWIDLARGKVDKTHREFQQGLDSKVHSFSWNNESR